MALIAALWLAACSANPPPSTGARRQAEPVGTPAPAPPPEVAAPAPAPEPSSPPSTQPPPPPERATLRDLEPAPEGVDAEAVDETDARARLAESLETYERAQRLWERGELYEAYAALDRAYELMASVPPNGDPEVAREKENLRQLIADRIVQIHRSELSAAVDLNTEIPLVMNEYVEREIASFQTQEREFFLAAYERSGLYRPMIVERLREAGMPDQLGWLPMVESWFKVRAYSRAGALGMWQFISSTGYRYGLRRDWWIDERMDPEKSTASAIGYLTDLHALFGDWLTALAGYNCGEGNVKRAIERQREDYLDGFWDIYTRLPQETRRYVPRFLATLHILKDPQAFGFVLPEPLPAQSYELVDTQRSIELTSMDSLLGLEPGSLEALNPELRRKATPEESYALKVPSGTAPTLTASLERLPAWVAPASLTTSYRVRGGDTLSAIASRHGTSVAALMELNDLRSANRIHQGQTLRVPDTRPAGSVPVATSGEATAYRVRAGDSLWSLAKRYGTTVDRIKRQNRLASNTLQPGQVLTLGGGGGGDAGTYVVRSGDTLGKIADRQGVALSHLLAANGLNRRSTIYPGQRLLIPR